MNLQRREITKVFSTIDLARYPNHDAHGRELCGKQELRSAGYTQHFSIRRIWIAYDHGAVGFSASGLPIGLQITGAPFAESTVLALAQALMSAKQHGTRGVPS